MIDTIIIDETLLIKNFDLEPFLEKLLDLLEEYMSDKLVLPNLKSNILDSLAKISNNKEYYSNNNLLTTLLLDSYKSSEVMAFNSHTDNFFHEKLPILLKDYHFNEDAKTIIDILKKKSYIIVFKVKPVFPESFAMEMLHAAGLSINDFDLITTNDISHYDDTNFRFYQEMISKLHKSSSSKEDECLYVTSFQDKLDKSSKLGLLTYYLTLNENTENLPFTYKGNYDDFRRFVENLSKAFITIDA